MRMNNLPHNVYVYGDAMFRGECPTEDMEQVTFFNRLRQAHPDTWGQLALHPRNEQQLRGGQHRAMIRQKAEGMTPGAADIIVPGHRTFVCELKRRDHTKSQWQNGQVEYLTVAANAGAFACVALGADAAWLAFLAWRDVAK